MPVPRRGSRFGALALRWHRFRTHRRIVADGISSIRVPFEGIRIHYYEGGPAGADTVVLLHGFLDTAQTFRRMFRSLRRRFRFVAIDLPGFGLSTLPEIRQLWDLRAMARVLGRFLRFQLQLDRPLVLTHSMGGLLSLHAAEYMQAVYNVRLFSEMHFVAPGLLRLHEHERDERRRLLYPETRDQIRQTLDALYHDEIPELPDLILDGLLHAWSVPGYFYLAENTVDEEDDVFFTMPRLRRVKIPLRLYWGEKDQMTPITLGERIARAIPGTKLFRFPNSGHALHIEESGSLAERFLVEAASSPSPSRRGPRRPKRRRSARR